jgi:hypothetical protein
MRVLYQYQASPSQGSYIEHAEHAHIVGHMPMPSLVCALRGRDYPREIQLILWTGHISISRARARMTQRKPSISMSLYRSSVWGRVERTSDQIMA